MQKLIEREHETKCNNLLYVSAGKTKGLFTRGFAKGDKLRAYELQRAFSGAKREKRERRKKKRKKKGDVAIALVKVTI